MTHESWLSWPATATPSPSSAKASPRRSTSATLSSGITARRRTDGHAKLCYCNFMSGTLPKTEMPALPIEDDERHGGDVDAFIDRNREALNDSIRRSRAEVED